MIDKAYDYIVTFREEGGKNIDLVRFSDSKEGKSGCSQSLPLIDSLLQTAGQGEKLSASQFISWMIGQETVIDGICKQKKE